MCRKVADGADGFGICESQLWCGEGRDSGALLVEVIDAARATRYTFCARGLPDPASMKLLSRVRLTVVPLDSRKIFLSRDPT